MSTVMTASSGSGLPCFFSYFTGQNSITLLSLIARETEKSSKAVFPPRSGKWIVMDNWQPSPQRTSPQFPHKAVWGTVLSML